MTHWSCRTPAKQVGISRTAVHRIWREHELKPHWVKGFKVSNDPQFEEMLRDVMGCIWIRRKKYRVFRGSESQIFRHWILATGFTDETL